MEAWRSGSRFGDLEIVRGLANGAFGQVYLARDLLVGRYVALKVVELPGSGPVEEEKDALLREARLVGKLKGPHVATLYRVHPLPERGWAFELEYVEGGSLEDRIHATPRIPFDEARRIVRGILLGLKEAHDQGIVHGDVKPGNVLFATDGTVKLVDFGLSRLIGDLSLRVPPAAVVGTPVYMAPEIVMGEHPTRASDLWSVGAVLYRMIAGRLPFFAKTLPTLFYAIQNGDPLPLDPDLPRPLADLAMRCLSKAPEQRPASCADALSDLEPVTVAEAAPRAAAARAPQASRLHGRRTEQEALDRAAQRAAEAHGTTVLLRGEAGAGKTALAHDLMARSDRHGYRWIQARVSPIEGLLRPLLTGARDLLGTSQGREESLVESRLFGTATNLLRALLEEESPVRIDSRQQVFWGVEDLLAGLAADRPLGILVEDVHQADEADLRLLQEIARRLRDARVLLLVALRPGRAADGFSGFAEEGGSILDLGPLDPDAVSRLLQERAHGSRVDPEVLRRVLDVAEGNPLLTIEVFRHLQETRALTNDRGMLVPGPTFQDIPLPSRVRDLVLLRARDLREDERAILDVAAVDGIEFDGEAVAAAWGRPVLDVLRAAQRIYRATGLVVPRTRGFRFANAAVQEGIYEELAPDLRRTLHRCLAEHLETRSERTAGAEARLGIHWERAGEPAKAGPHLMRAAQEALARQESLRALDLARRAGLGPEHLDPETAVRHSDLLLELCSALTQVGRIEEIEAAYARLSEGARLANDIHLELKVMILRATTRYQSQGLVGLDEEALLQAVRTLPACGYQGRAWYLLGQVSKYRGDLDEAERRFRLADEGYIASGDLGRHSSALDQLGSVALRRGRWSEAEALYGDAARISAMVGRRTNAALSEGNRALASVHRGTVDGILARLDDVVRVLLREGSFHHASSARVLLAEARYALGDLPGAKAAIDDALPTLRRERYLGGLIPALRQRAHFAAVEGFLDVAGEALAEMERLAQLRHDTTNILQGHALACHVACFAGDLARGRSAARQTLATAKTVRELPPRADALLWLAEACIHGAPVEMLEEAETLVADAREEDAHVVLRPLALVRAARALATRDGDASPLLAAAERLGAEDVGLRRAASRVLGGLLEAEGRARAGYRDGAKGRAERALEDARALGHVWLTLRLRALLARLGDARQAAILKDELQHLAARLPTEEERRMLVAAWPAPA